MLGAPGKHRRAMHDMTAKETAKPAALPAYTPHPNFARHHKQFPTTAWMRRKAPHNVPRFAFEYGDTGAGNDVGIQHNWAAFDAIKVSPRYGKVITPPPAEVELFGTRYNAPIGIAPMGAPSLVWPGADVLMAQAAQRARVPYALSTAGGLTIEEAARHAPDVFWLQLYRFWRDDHKIGFDLMRRAEAVGTKVLALTLDVPVRTTRSRETYAGLGGEFRPNARMLYEMLVRPKWLLAFMRRGYPRFATISEYAKSNNTNAIIRFARANMGGAFTWEEVKRYRDVWKGKLAVKGVLHPADAEQAVALGIEGIWVSNHGGRQIEALSPSIDVLAGDRCGGRQQGHRPPRQRRALGPGRDARARARRRCGLCRQVVPVGGGGARRGRPGPAHRSLYRRAARLARPDRRPFAGRGAAGHRPASRRDQVLVFSVPVAIEARRRLAALVAFSGQAATAADLPSFDGGEPLVDIADRNALLGARDGR